MEQKNLGRRLFRDGFLWTLLVIMVMLALQCILLRGYLGTLRLRPVSFNGEEEHAYAEMEISGVSVRAFVGQGQYACLARGTDGTLHPVLLTQEQHDLICADLRQSSRVRISGMAQKLPARAASVLRPQTMEAAFAGALSPCCLNMTKLPYQAVQDWLFFLSCLMFLGMLPFLAWLVYREKCRRSTVERIYAMGGCALAIQDIEQSCQTEATLVLTEHYIWNRHSGVMIPRKSVADCNLKRQYIQLPLCGGKGVLLVSTLQITLKNEERIPLCRSLFRDCPEAEAVAMQLGAYDPCPLQGSVASAAVIA